MDKSKLILAAIISVACLIGWYLYLEHNRFQVIKSKLGVAYEVDRKTGTSWTITPGERILNKDENQKVNKNKIQVLPVGEKSKIKGTSRVEYGLFSGEIYNGSDWTIKEILLKLEALDKTGKTLWNRKYRDTVSIDPLTTGSFQVKVLKDEKAKGFIWDLIEVKGIPPQKN